MLEIYGTEGSLQCPDPNTFGGEVLVRTKKKNKWEKVPLTHSDQIGRGVGIADLAYAVQKRCHHRMNGELALHIVEVMEAFHVSAQAGRKIAIKSRCRQPKALPQGLALGQLA
jgi:predicted dehydrogenase